MIRRSEIHRFAAKLEAEAAEFERISHHPGITGTSQALDRASANILRDVAKRLRDEFAPVAVPTIGACMGDR